METIFTPRCLWHRGENTTFLWSWKTRLVQLFFEILCPPFYPFNFGIFRQILRTSTCLGIWYVEIRNSGKGIFLSHKRKNTPLSKVYYNRYGKCKFLVKFRTGKFFRWRDKSLNTGWDQNFPLGVRNKDWSKSPRIFRGFSHDFPPGFSTLTQQIYPWSTPDFYTYLMTFFSSHSRRIFQDL